MRRGDSSAGGQGGKPQGDGEGAGRRQGEGQGKDEKRSWVTRSSLKAKVGIADVDPGLCRALSEFYSAANARLYALLRDTGGWPERAVAKEEEEEEEEQQQQQGSRRRRRRTEALVVRSSGGRPSA